LKKPRCIFFLGAIVVSILAVIGWVLGATQGFNRGLDLMLTVALIVCVIPLSLLIVIAIVWLVKAYKDPERELSILTVLILSTLMLVLSGIITFDRNMSAGVIADFIYADTLRRTDDGLFEYRIELVNLFQRNATARLFVRDLTTDEEMYIPLDVPARDVGGLSIPHRRNFLWGRLENDVASGQYLLRMPAGSQWRDTYINDISFQFQRIHTFGNVTFTIDIPSRTATRVDQ